MQHTPTLTPDPALPDDAQAVLETTRRAFLGGGGAALVVGFALPLAAPRVQAQPGAAALLKPNAWVRIGRDGGVTVACGSAEMGQGVLTAIPMLLAEELDADWRTVRVEQAPVDQAYANPAFKMQATGGSTTVRGHWDIVRRAGAQARAVLVAAAAREWGTAPTALRTDAGAVVHPDGRRLPYGALVEAASALPVPPADGVTLKPKSARRIMGQPLARLDTPAKVDGSARYGLDVQLPGMLVAVMKRIPQEGARFTVVDDAAAKAVPGVRAVIALPSGVAVLADGFWAARQGRDALKLKLEPGAWQQVSTDTVMARLRDAAGRPGAVALKKGEPGPIDAARAVQATYEAPYLAHACMEPMNCTAHVTADAVEVWVGSQSQGPVQGILSQVAAVQPGKVKVHTMMLGGGFGRRFAPDVVIDATLLSKLSGRPVKLVYTREDDMAAGYYRPVAVARFSGAVDASGRIQAFQAGVASPSVTVASGFMPMPENGVDTFAVEGILDHPYDIERQRIDYNRFEPGPKVWFWRSVGHSQNSFFMESFVDELAHAAGADPYEFRRAHLGKSPRHKRVLELAAQKAGWGSPLPAGRHRGIAVVSSFGSYVAEVAEVSVAADGTPRVHRVVAAVDAGQIVNPRIVERQVEGAIVFGLTAALHGRISHKDGLVEQSNFHDYPLLRIDQMPKVEVHIVDSDDAPGGIGEPGTPPIAPAVANAIFAATGKRVRSLPIDPALLKRA